MHVILCKNNHKSLLKICAVMCLCVEGFEQNAASGCLSVIGSMGTGVVPLFPNSSAMITVTIFYSSKTE
jgi:hypothetical protein